MNINNNMNNNNFSNHQLIKNSNQYVFEKKYITISSEDRDVTKFPDSSEFEIFFPQEYLNIVSARLASWSFPANYNVFSVPYHNTTMTFKMENLYNPTEHLNSSKLLEGIYSALLFYGSKDIILTIETGFYNPSQMATELTNKFNMSVSIIIGSFFNDPSLWNGNDYTIAKDQFEKKGGYNRFKVVYNAVSQQLWFGNNADKFTITNDSTYLTEFTAKPNCARKNQLPEWSNWGLPSNLGFTRCNATAYSTSEYLSRFPDTGSIYNTLNNSTSVPRFFYGDAVPGSGDNGFWLEPELSGAIVYFLQAPLKISFMGPPYIYMEIEGWNCIDETAPYNLSLYTSTNNKNNGVVNSCFAKIAVPTTPISQWFDNNMAPYKYWNPPAERMSKLKVKFRYHNGVRPTFGDFEFSFMIELNLLTPQQERSYSIVNAFDLVQHDTLGNKFF